MLEYIDSGLYIQYKRKIILYIRCYWQDPDPMKQDPEPNPFIKVAVTHLGLQKENPYYGRRGKPISNSNIW